MLATRAAQVSLDDSWDIAKLVGALRGAGARDAAIALAIRAVAQVSLDGDLTVGPLLRELREAGASDAIRTLATRASLHDPHAVAWLLGALRDAGASDAVRTLLNRDSANHVSLDDLRTVGVLLRALHEAGADDAVTALATRAAARVSLDDPLYVDLLLQALTEVGASRAVTVLAARAANAGMFDVFLEARPDEASDYLFGREPDGTPSQSWRWQEPGELALTIIGTALFESRTRIAMFNLGTLLENSDPDQARQWYERAAQALDKLPTPPVSGMIAAAVVPGGRPRISCEITDVIRQHRLRWHHATCANAAAAARSGSRLSGNYGHSAGTVPPPALPRPCRSTSEVLGRALAGERN